MRKQKQIPISSFLHPKTKIINKSISLSSSSINVLDELDHYVCSEIESLDLSCNKLISLKGIQQFTSLKQLNIADNKIGRCQELQYLKQLLELKKLYLGNNPFLNQPINENVLDFIFDKETDIEILSFEVLSSLKDVEEREMKIIFLKNYIQKIDLHSELKDKSKATAQSPAMRPQEVISKIVPQFYTIIEDPRIANKIKKEAIGKRKSSHETFEEVLEVQKKEKEKLINHLIKDIVTLLHQSEEFKKSPSFLLEVNLNENTVTFSPEKRELSYKMDNLSQDYSPVRHIEASKDEASIEELTLSNQRNYNTQTFQRGSNKPSSLAKSSYFLQSSERKKVTPDSDYDTLETARKNVPNQSIEQKLKQHTNFKMSYQSQIKRIREREHQNQQKIQKFDRNNENVKRQAESPKSFQVNKFRKNIQSPKKKIQYIKVIEQNLQQSQDNKQVVEQIPSNFTKDLHSPRNIGFSNVTARYSTITSQQITPEAIQTLYFKTLIKTNPMFTLLHSPANSLKSEEKSELLEALKQDHRERFIELFKERHNNQQLMRELERVGLEHNKEVQTIIQNNKSIYNQYIVYKEEIEWAEERRRAIQQQYDQIVQLYKISEANEKKKGTALSILENNYKKLRQAYGEKNERVQFLENCNQKEETIREIRQNNLVKAYLSKIQLKAELWDKILKLQEKSRKTNEKYLIKFAFLGFRINKFHQKSLKKLSSRIDNTLLKAQFYDWKDIAIFQRKVRQIDFLFLKKRSGQSTKLLKANEADSKMKKLKNIWADRFLKDHLHKKSMKLWKKVMLQLRLKNEKADKFRVQYVKQSIIYSLLNIIKSRKQYVQNIGQKRTSRLFISEFKRMIFLMNKQKLEIEQKYRDLGKNLEYLRKKQALLLLMARTKRSARFKEIKKRLEHSLFTKNIAIFRKTYKNDRGLQKKLKKILLRIKKQICLKILTRQKLSNYLQQSLRKQKILSFIKPLKQYYKRQSFFHNSSSQLNSYFIFKSILSKVKFIKTLQVLKLKGKNYIKKRELQQMQHQMDLNDLNALDLVKAQKDEISKRDKEIIFLKNQIQSLAIRQAALLQEKDENMLSIQESYEIMVELRTEVDNLRLEYSEQERKYNSMVGLYNQTLNSLDEKERECLKLYSKLRQSKK